MFNRTVFTTSDRLMIHLCNVTISLQFVSTVERNCWIFHMIFDILSISSNRFFHSSCINHLESEWFFVGQLKWEWKINKQYHFFGHPNMSVKWYKGELFHELLYTCIYEIFWKKTHGWTDGWAGNVTGIVEKSKYIQLNLVWASFHIKPWQTFKFCVY